MIENARFANKTFPLNQYDEFTQLVVRHGRISDIDKETEKAILVKWSIELDEVEYNTNWVWIPKSLLDIPKE